MGDFQSLEAGKALSTSRALLKPPPPNYAAITNIVEGIPYYHITTLPYHTISQEYAKVRSSQPFGL